MPSGIVLIQNCNSSFESLSLTETLNVGLEFGAIGASGFFIAYVIVAMLFWLRCSVRCIDLSLSVVACECCPESCCIEEGHGSDDEDEDADDHGTSKKSELKVRGGDGDSSADGMMDSDLSHRLISNQPLSTSTASEEDYASFDVGLAPAKGVTKQKESSFGAFLIVVELVATVPESLVLADSLSSGVIRPSLITSIIVLNVVMGFAMFIDIMRPREEQTFGHANNRVYQLLFVSITASAGMLVYALSVEVFFNFSDDCDNEDSLGLLILGTFVGGILIVFLAWFGHSKYAAPFRRKLEDFCACCKSTSSPVRLREGGSLWSNSYVKSFFLMLLLSLWLLVCTLAGVAIFRNVSASEAFIEGVSGGAFIIAISGTLIPEAQIAASKTNLSNLQKEVLSAVCFLVGFIIAVALEEMNGEH